MSTSVMFTSFLLISRRAVEESESEEDEETPADKRLRLAKQLIAQIEEEERDADTAEVDTVAVAERLHAEMLAERGQLRRQLAAGLDSDAPVASTRVGKGHQLPVTCVVVSSTGQHIYTGSKDRNIIKWDATTMEKVVILQGWSPRYPDGPVGSQNHIE